MHSEKFCALWLAKGVGRPIFKVLVIGWDPDTQESEKQSVFKTCDPFRPKSAF